MCRAEPCGFLISSAVPFRVCAVVNVVRPRRGKNCSVPIAASQFGKQFPAHYCPQLAPGTNSSPFPQFPVNLDPLRSSALL